MKVDVVSSGVSNFCACHYARVKYFRLAADTSEYKISDTCGKLYIIIYSML